MSIYLRGRSVLFGCIPGCLQIVPMELTIVPGGLPPPQTPLTDRPPGRPTGRDMQHEGTMPLRIMRGCDMTFATGDVAAPQIEGPSWCTRADHGIPVSAPRQALHRSGRLAAARGGEGRHTHRFGNAGSTRRPLHWGRPRPAAKRLRRGRANGPAASVPPARLEGGRGPGRGTAF